MENIIILIIVGFIIYLLFKFFASSEKNVVKDRIEKEDKIIEFKEKEDSNFNKELVIDEFHKSIMEINNSIIRSSLFEKNRFNLNNYSLNYNMRTLYKINFGYNEKEYSYFIGLKIEKKTIENTHSKSLKGKICVTPLSFLLEEIEELKTEYELDQSFKILRDIENSLKDEKYRKQLSI